LFHDWKNRDYAMEWDRNPLRDNPAREEQLQILLTLVNGTYQVGQSILDLGCGSGIVEERLFQTIPGVRVVGIDSSPSMLELAASRLRRWSERLDLIESEFNSLDLVKTAIEPFGIVISVQALHNVSHDIKKRVFRQVRQVLDRDGAFYILDRIRIDPELFEQTRLVLERLATLHNVTINEGLTYPQHVELLKQRGDDPASLKEHLDWLRDAGFLADCVYSYGNRALVIARPI